MKSANHKTLHTLPFAFGDGFLEDHAGHILTDPGVAMIELIANSYDAGATQVEIRWPSAANEELSISDDGTGMTTDEFHRRWKTLKYNRSEEQGPSVVFPPNVRAKNRVAFGQSGKGRHGAFCFADQYRVETVRDGQRTIAMVSRTQTGSEPFHCEVTGVEKASGHGTRLVALATRNIIQLDKVVELVGSKFAVDPEFRIIINGSSVALLSLDGVKTAKVQVGEFGEVAIHEIESAQQERNTRFRGITWWVNKRMVGQSSWAGLDDKGAILDGRTTHAKKYSFIIEADYLKPDVKPDWSGFYDTRKSNQTRDATKEYVVQRLHALLSSTRRERKIEVLRQHREVLGQLPELSKHVIGQFIDEVQQNCPTLSEGDLSRTVTVLSKLEQSRSGYDLLERLSNCSLDDLDTWNRLMAEWSASHAEIVLSELGRRLKLIDDLTRLVHEKNTDELHDLQPLFARGLWMFGPEFESADFSSNRSMATVMRQLLGGASGAIAAQRPDIVVLPDSTLGIYAADAFDEHGEIGGLRSVAIVELKKGGFHLSKKEVRQAEDYIGEIQKSRLVQDTTKITAFVLGAVIDDAQMLKIGDSDTVKIIPMTYDTLLRKAHARTFQLKSKLEQVAPSIRSDEDIETTLKEPVQTEMPIATVPTK